MRQINVELNNQKIDEYIENEKDKEIFRTVKSF
jgi:hypothetical protein